jgi:hypothetical protein
MNKTLRVIIGAVTLWPITYAMFFIGMGFFAFFFPAHALRWDFLLLPLHLVTILWVWALLVFYLIHLFKTARVLKDQKVLWAVVLFMGNMIAMPVYWYLYIWSDAPVGIVPPSRSELRSPGNELGPAAASTSSRDLQYSPPSEMPNWRE